MGDQCCHLDLCRTLFVARQALREDAALAEVPGDDICQTVFTVLERSRNVSGHILRFVICCIVLIYRYRLREVMRVWDWQAIIILLPRSMMTIFRNGFDEYQWGRALCLKIERKTH